MPTAPSSLLLVLVASLVVLLALLARRKRFRTVPGPPATSFWHGSDAQFLDGRTGQSFQDEIVRRYGMIVRVRRGFLRDDHLFVCDPIALQHMLVKDQTNFEQGATQQETTRLIHGPGLLSSTGERHKRQRRLLNPVFTAPHLRRLVPVFHDVASKLADVLEKTAGTRDHDVDVLGHLSRTALELIGQGGLGHSFSADGPYTLSETLKDLLPSVFQYVHWWPLLRPLRAVFGPHLLRRAAEGISRHSAPAARLKRNIDALDDATAKIFARKKQAVLEGRFSAEDGGDCDAVDIISQLLLANARAPVDERHPDDELRAHMATLITAGRDTVSHVVARTLQVLAERSDVQDALRAELANASGDFDFDALMALPYLDAVIREMLRLYSTISFVNRTVQHDTVLPLLDGQPVVVPGGTTIRIGLATANTAPVLWGADAREFRPERWLKDKEGKGKETGQLNERALPGVWSNIMSFMGGPRGCIGYRFALLEMKVLLSVLLRRFRFLPASKDMRVEWYLGPSNTPYIVGRESEGPKLPLRIESLGST
ncbi:cytochrome P450 [Exidia glandulosa HHB12029]|uniref:Cytochrome P450 n=1 Tax=Exidia glandulosa HHB12029 TaxID=1314781 RepID=A0A165J9J4_EXIGL|nr:cytochrome P450 [Exidia glandulosa HHB12029]